MAYTRCFVAPDSISKHLHCAICTEVYTQPQRLPCQHIFCLACITHWATERPTCPQCRKKFSAKKLVRDLLAANLVDELKVRCSHKGCGWVGASSDLETHCESCLFHPGRGENWLSPLMSNQPSLLYKLLERDPEATKAFMNRSDAKPQPRFFDLSDEENYSDA